MTNKNN